MNVDPRLVGRPVSEFSCEEMVALAEVVVALSFRAEAMQTDHTFNDELGGLFVPNPSTAAERRGKCREIAAGIERTFGALSTSTTIELALAAGMSYEYARLLRSNAYAEALAERGELV